VSDGTYFLYEGGTLDYDGFEARISERRGDKDDWLRCWTWEEYHREKRNVGDSVQEIIENKHFGHATVVVTYLDGTTEVIGAKLARAVAA
jgi:hypothetical protein